MDFLPSPRPSRADFSGPLRNSLCVRSGGWLRRFEDGMLEVASGQDLEDALSDVEASIGDLISAVTSLMLRILKLDHVIMSIA